MALARRIVLGVFGLIAMGGLAASQNPPKINPAPKEPDTTAEDQKAVAAVGVGVDGPALLDYFRKRTLPTADPKKVEALIRQLGDDEFTTREQAFTALSALGAAATPGLKRFEADADIERRKRVLELKLHIEVKAEPMVQAAVARLIAKTRPAGAADVLLAYLPFAVDAAVVNEICKTLGAVAVVDGKVEPAVMKALADASPLKRAAAGEALVRANAKQELAAARTLLKDADAQVRLRVALALMTRHDKEVVPVLIDLLAVLGPDQLAPAEDVLVVLAGDKAPTVALGTTDVTRKAARDAWQKWYTANKTSIDLAKLEQPEVQLGYITLVSQTPNRIVGGRFRGVTYKVMEIKASDKSKRWDFETNTQIVDAQVVGENRVIAAEYQMGRVTEYDFKGKSLWSKAVLGNPISVQKLPNGNIFVVKTNGLMELDRKGNEVFSYQHQQQPFNQNIVRGKKLRNGQIVFVSNTGANAIVTRMDARTHKVLKTFPVSQVGSLFGNMDVLPTGGVLVPDWQHQPHRISEYDRDGKLVKTFSAMWPLGATRLANGDTLVSAQNPGRVIQFDRNGRDLWTYPCEGQVFNARRR